MKQKPERKKISLEAYSKKLRAKAKEKVIKDGNDALRHLESYADGIPLKVIKNFVYANFKSFVLQNIEAIDFNKGFTINREDKSFKGDFGISLHNANELNKFSEVYSRLSYLLLFLEKTNHYKKQLELVKDVDTGDYTNYQFLKTWWEENFPDAFDINQRLFWIEYEDQTTYKLTDLVPGFYTPSKHLPNIKIKKQDIAQLFDFIATVDTIETVIEKMR